MKRKEKQYKAWTSKSKGFLNRQILITTNLFSDRLNKSSFLGPQPCFNPKAISVLLLIN